LLEHVFGQCTSLTENENTVAKSHDGGNRLDLQRTRDALFGLGVDLCESDVGVSERSLLEHGREHLARPAPLGPEVDERDALGGDCGLEIGFGQVDGCHGNSVLRMHRSMIPPRVSMAPA
jgi:hypothetical protein